MPYLRTFFAGCFLLLARSQSVASTVSSNGHGDAPATFAAAWAESVYDDSTTGDATRRDRRGCPTEDTLAPDQATLVADEVCLNPGEDSPAINLTAGGEGFKWSDEVMSAAAPWQRRDLFDGLVFPLILRPDSVIAAATKNNTPLGAARSASPGPASGERFQPAAGMGAASDAGAGAAAAPTVGGPLSAQAALTTWVEAHRDKLLAAALAHGAVLLRGFPVDGNTPHRERTSPRWRKL